MSRWKGQSLVNRDQLEANKSRCCSIGFIYICAWLGALILGHVDIWELEKAEAAQATQLEQDQLNQLKTPKRSDRLIAGLKGNVRRVIEDNVTIISGEPVRSRTPTRSTTYDIIGNKIESEVYGIKGELQLRTVWTYDDSGNKVAWAAHNADGTVRDKGSIIHENKKQSSTKYERWYDEAGILSDTTVTNYDAVKKLWIKAWKKPESEQIRLLESFDMRGNKVEIVEYDDHQMIKKRTTSLFDIKDNEIETDFFGPGGDLQDRWTIVYDDQGNQTQFVTHNYQDQSHLILVYTYEGVDAKGNWAKQTQSSAGEKRLIPHKIAYRTISYY